ncbi:MAG: hypothetical protein DI538_30710 [Azospira oryzae]|jgi:hypothetical protein|nr:MAG: hypothetical protein DI538_30710 [Azospira oryzae]
MNKFSFDVSVEANSQEEAMAKLKAASVLMQKLKPNEISRLAEVVKNDPIKTAIAKKALGL